MKMNEKMIAGILGFAVGDALGVPVEFQSRAFLESHPIKDMIGYGSHKVPEGTWSDDTSLMLAAMDSIIEQNGQINYYDIMLKFCEWVDNCKYTATGVFFDIGISTSDAINRFKSGIDPLNCGSVGIRENGNGSLMRILPFVYFINNKDFTENEKNEIINNSSSLTHKHEISRLGCKIYNDYISALLAGKNKFEALEHIQTIDYSRYFSSDSINYYNRILLGKLNNIKKEDIKSSGFIVSTLEAAIWCTLKCDTFEDSVLCAVNLGQDTDTVGAITGAINGIIYGKDSIPKRWIEHMKNFDYLESLSNKYLETLNYNNKKRL